MQFQRATVPFASGLDEATDPRLVPVGKLLDCENGFADQRGAIVKRLGFTRLTRQLADGDAVGSSRGLLSTGVELLSLGAHRLYGYNPIHPGWHDRGQIAPAVGHQKIIFHDAYSYVSSDMDRLGDFVMYAGHRERQVDADAVAHTSRQFSIILRVDSSEGVPIIPPVAYETATAAAEKPHTIRVAHCAGKLIALWEYGSPVPVTNPSTLRLYEYPTATPTTNPVWHSNITTDLYFSNEGARTFDAIGLDVTHPGQWFECHIIKASGAFNIVVNRRRSDHTVTATRTIDNSTGNAPYFRVAIAESPNVALNQLYILAVADDGETAAVVELWGLDATTLATNFGPITIHTLAHPSPAEVADNIGVAEGNGRVACVWTNRFAGGLTSSGWGRLRAQNRSTDTSGGTLDAVKSIYNASARSRPFWHDNRCYVFCNSGNETELFEYVGLWDIAVNESVSPWIPNPRDPVFCGIHDVGTGATGTSSLTAVNSLLIGAGQNVVSFPAGCYRYMSCSLAFSLAEFAQRFSVDEVEADFGTAPLATVVTGGSAVIGGTFVSWYAGAGKTEELGHAMGPIIDSITATSAGISPGLATTTLYSYQAVWEYYDELGNWHRSLPSPTDPARADRWQETTGGGVTPSLTLTTKTNPATIRLTQGKDVAVVYYRLDLSDGIYKRASPPLRMVPNRDTDHVVEDWIDYGQTLGPALYTDGGIELEAVMPEGARIPVVASERLWLADFFRRSRLQYSKRFTPGTAAEDVRAPEFNEGFGMVLPGGERITGVGDLDDKVVVFTERDIYLIAGLGPDDAGRSNDFSQPTQISDDAGCIEARSVVSFPGGLFFQSKAGLYTLSRNLSLQFAGEPVRKLTTTYPVITSAVLAPKFNQVRFTATTADGSSGIILVFDYRAGDWFYWALTQARIPLVGACMHLDRYYVAEASGQVWEQSLTTWYDDGDQYVPLKIEVAWLAPPSTSPGATGGQQSAWQRVRYIVPLCERRAAHNLIVQLAHDFEADYGETYTYTDAVIAAWPGQPREQPKVRARRQQCEAIKVRIEDAAPAAGTITTGEGFSIIGITLDLGTKPGIVRTATAQRN